ncbi:MAG: NifU N-terminal domain-containing protein [Phycisphaerales bacterium]
MPFAVREFEPTPNPNAMKCLLDRRISDGPRSFLNAAAAAANPLAAALFREADATTVLFCDDWITVNKRPDATWAAVKRKIERVLAAAPAAGALEATS